MFWRQGQYDNFEMGWLLEASNDGCAFAWRGEGPPQVGAVIDVCLDMSSSQRETKSAVVRRVRVAHADMTIIAAELMNIRDFPPALSAVIDETKPFSARKEARDEAAISLATSA